MPKVHVDASVVANGNAFGRVSGLIELSVVPQVGDMVTLWPRGSSSDAVVDLLRVTDRIIFASQGGSVSLALSDIVVATDDEARKVLRFLHEDYGLIGDVWADET